MSGNGKQLGAAIGGWLAGLAPGVAELAELPIPEDDDYGLELSLALRPSEPRACPMEIGITTPERGAATYLILDSWEGIGRRFALQVRPAKERLIGLAVEPLQLSLETVLEVCDRVAAGAVRLELATCGGRLVGTGGSVELRAGPLPMRGVGVPPGLARILPFLGLACRQGLYAPWR